MNKEKNVISSNLGLLLLIVAVLGWFFVVSPQINTYSNEALQVKSTTTIRDSYNQRLSDLKTIADGGTALTSLLQRMDIAMPKSSQIPEVLVMVQSLANSSGVILSGVNIGTAATTASAGTSTVSQVPVSISFDGTQDNLTSFLNAINNNIRAGIVQSQTISADDNGNLSVTLQLGLAYQGGN